MRSLFTLFLLFTCSLLLHAQLTLQVVSLPGSTPPDAPLYVAGTFNNWEPGSADWQLQDNGDNTWQITFNPPAGQLKFKFTRGSWATVEGDANGNFRPDRTYNYDGSPTTLPIEILSWEDLDGGSGGNSTAEPNVQVLSDSFYIPQLDRYRRIWLYLPPDYDTSNKEYPVLYMHDGQNLFDNQTAPFGEWEVDESLNELFDNGDYGIIVVGIDHGGTSRLDELAPWVNPQYGGGEGEAYIDFIVENLKPWIDGQYRTLPGRAHTGIMGSSLGGLISMYAGLEHPQTFSKVGIFSPAFWYNPEIFSFPAQVGKQLNTKFYLLGGEQESLSMVPNMLRMRDSLLANGFTTEEIKLVTHADGQHSEWYWAREFPDAYLWLFGDLVLAGTQLVPEAEWTLYPNPATDWIRLQGEGEEGYLEIHSLQGCLMLQRNFRPGQSIPLHSLRPGLYTLRLWQDNRLQKTGKLVIKP